MLYLVTALTADQRTLWAYVVEDVEVFPGWLLLHGATTHPGPYTQKPTPKLLLALAKALVSVRVDEWGSVR